jgi:hypothetical protein
MLDRPRLNETAGDATGGARMDFQSAGERRGTAAGSAATASKRAVSASLTPPPSHCRPRHAPPQQFRLLDCTSDSRRGRTGPRPSREGQTRSRSESGGSWRRSPRQSGQFPDPAQMAVPALRTERRILARDPLIDRFPVLALVGLRSRRSGSEQDPAALHVGRQDAGGPRESPRPWSRPSALRLDPAG